MVNFACVKDFKDHSLKILPKDVKDFFHNGAGQQETLDWNSKAFSEYKIKPRCLRNVSKRNLSTTVLGKRVSMPIGISPFSLHKLAHSDGEKATIKAAQTSGTIFILSTASSIRLEDVAAAAPNVTKWFQLYIYKDRNVTKELIQRAEKSGYEAIVLTVDTPLCGIRLEDIRNNFSLPSHLSLANFVGDKSNFDSGTSHSGYVNSQFDSSLEWTDVQWLKTITKLPIILKGIMTVEDAKLAVDVGASGIMISNHGGRQLDSVPATIEVLPEICRAVGDKLEVYIDGGISTGVDVFKAIALGAKMAFIGRSALWGLVCNGEKGVENVLKILKNEFDNTMALSGCFTVEDIQPNMIVHKSHFSKL